MRRLLASSVFVLLAACAAAPQDPPALTTQVATLAATPAAGSSSLEAQRFIAADGTVLPLRSWLPEGAPKAVVLALHGFNDYSNGFAIPAWDWAAEGIATYAYDQRGFGAAPQRGQWAGTAALAEDATVAARLLRQRHPGVPLYLLGESMGGAVSIVAMTSAERPPVDGLILVAPAVWGKQTMPWWQRAGLWIASVVPPMHVSPKSVSIVRQASDNIPMLRAYSADPMVIKETRTDAVVGLTDLMTQALDAARRLDAPTLVLYGEKDEIVPRGPVAQMVAALPPEARTRQRVALYRNGWHMLLRDLDGARVGRDVAAWMTSRSAPLPSGADKDARYALTGIPATIAAR